MGDDRKREEDDVKIPDLEIRESAPTHYHSTHLHVDRHVGFVGPFTNPGGEVYSEGSMSSNVYGAGVGASETDAKVFPPEIVAAVGDFPDVAKAGEPVLDDATVQKDLLIHDPLHAHPTTHLHVDRHVGFVGPFTNAGGEVYSEGSMSSEVYGAGVGDTQTGAKVFPPEIVAAVGGFPDVTKAGEPILDDATVENALKIHQTHAHTTSHLHVERTPGFIGPFTNAGGEVYSEGSTSSNVYGAGPPEIDAEAKVFPQEIVDAIKIVDAKEEKKDGDAPQAE